MTSNFDLFREAQRISEENKLINEQSKEQARNNESILNEMKLALLEYVKTLSGKECKYGKFRYLLNPGHPDTFLLIQVYNQIIGKEYPSPVTKEKYVFEQEVSWEEEEYNIAWFKSTAHESGCRIWAKFYNPANSIEFSYEEKEGLVNLNKGTIIPIEEFYGQFLDIRSLDDIPLCLPKMAKRLSVWFY